LAGLIPAANSLTPLARKYIFFYAKSVGIVRVRVGSYPPVCGKSVISGLIRWFPPNTQQYLRYHHRVIGGGNPDYTGLLGMQSHARCGTAGVVALLLSSRLPNLFVDNEFIHIQFNL